MSKVAVVGAGVVGLTSAHELSSKFDVTVFYDPETPPLASLTATAIWHVYLVDPSDQTYLTWSSRSLEVFLDLAVQPGSSAGVSLCSGVELFRTSVAHRPPWADIAVGFQQLSASELAQFPGIAWGYRISAPVADMADYMPWLRQMCIDRGVEFIARKIDSFKTLSREFDFVVNCTGLASRVLVGDSDLYPIKGQYVAYEYDGAMPSNYVGDDEHPDGMAYMIPRSGELLVGGTAEDNVWSYDFTVDVDDLLAKALLYCPSLDRGALVEKRRVVGLRPCRSNGKVRFGFDNELENLFHNYGHGGSGWSMSWGCAEALGRELGDAT